MDYSELKSGSDVRGTAIDGFGSKVNLTPEATSAIVSAFALGYGLIGKRVAVGCDSRLSGDSLKSAAITALTAGGCTVLDCGLCSTPAMFMTTKFDSTKAAAAIMITASHHPQEKNGLKFFLPSGGLSGKQISAILESAARGDALEAKDEGRVEKCDCLGQYSDYLKNKIIAAVGENPLVGMKIAVDAGNGAGGFYAHRVLAPLGADISGSKFLDPDGTFPNHVPNPENPTAMAAIAAAVTESHSDLGVIFDTDVDRAAIVGADGREINRNALIALIASIILDEEKGATIVTDSVTSDGLAEFITQKGGVHHRYKRGYKNVIDEAIRLSLSGVNAPLAIETSGHAALRENYYLDDGAYLVTRIIIEAVRLRRENKTLDSRLTGLHEARESLEVRLGFDTEHWREVGEYAIESAKRLRNRELIVSPVNHEGVRIAVPRYKGWFLLRMSVHDPIMPINIESDENGGAKRIARIIFEFLRAFNGINLKNLALSLD